MSGLIRNSMATAIMGSFLSLVVVTAPSVTWAVDVSAPQIPTKQEPCGAQGGGGKHITFGGTQCGAQGGGGKKSIDSNQQNGAGNSSGRREATDYDIKNAIKVSKFSLKLALRATLNTFSFHDDNPNNKIYYRIISKPNLFEDLESLNLKPQDEACVYEDGEKHVNTANEATIIGNNVCISVGELLKEKYSNVEILRKVTGLLGHEFAHKRGIKFTNDLDADKFRDSIEQRISNHQINEWLEAVNDTSILDQLRNSSDAFKNFRLNADQDLASACGAAAFAFGSNIMVLDSISKVEAAIGGNSDAMILSPTANAKITETMLRSAVVTVLGCGMKRASGTLDFSAFSIGLENADQMNIIDMFYNWVKIVLAEQPEAYGLTAAQKARFEKENSQEVYEQNLCGIDLKNCWGMRNTVIKKVKTHDLEAMKAEMFRAQLAGEQMKTELYETMNEAHDLIMITEGRAK